MELIITLIVLIIIWCIAFMVGNKQGANRIVNQIKKDGGYYDMEYTSTILRIQIENEILAKQGKYLTFSLETVDGEEIVILS